MTGPSSVPRGEHAGKQRPQQAVVWDETVVPDGEEPPLPVLNRQQRRAVQRAAARRCRR